jgi:hypothetical protein
MERPEKFAKRCCPKILKKIRSTASERNAACHARCVPDGEPPPRSVMPGFTPLATAQSASARVGGIFCCQFKARFRFRGPDERAGPGRPAHTRMTQVGAQSERSASS